MRNVKIVKIRFKNKNKKKIGYIKYPILICLTTLICIIPPVITIYFLVRIMLIKENILRKIYVNKNYNPEIVIYKGEKIQKKKLISDYLSQISENDSVKIHETELLNQYFYLDEYVDDPQIKLNITNKLLEKFSEIKGKKVNKIETVFVTQNNNFGNTIVTVNNAIFYCEAVGCKEVILIAHNLNRQWLFKNPVYIKEINIKVSLGSNADCNADNIICFQGGRWDPFYVEKIRPEIRIQYLRDELLNNLPKVITEPDELYVHFRGGDAFRQNPPFEYAQPPLCFYEKIFNNNKYKKIYFLSADRKNIVMDTLIKKYNYIIYNEKNYDYDLSLLIHGYNIVLATSSFSISAIKFNNNLRDLWEYDILHLSEKFVFLHHHLYKFDIKYKIHTMKPSETYVDKMFNWKNSESQLKLMLEDNCPYDFVITKPNK